MKPQKNTTKGGDVIEEEREVEATEKKIAKISRETEDGQENEETTGKLRPKRGEEIAFKVNGKNLQGIIKDVSKKSGKDANRCWVKFKGEDVRSFDFKDEVDSPQGELLRKCQGKGK